MSVTQDADVIYTASIDLLSVQSPLVVCLLVTQDADVIYTASIYRPLVSTEPPGGLYVSHSGC